MNPRSYDRFIPGEEIEAVEQWRFGAIDTAAQLLAAQTQQRQAQQAADQLAQAQQLGFQDGVAQGVIQGRADAQADVERRMQEFLAHQAQDAAQRLNALFASAQAQLQEAEQAMAQAVLALACELAREVLRRELSVDTAALMPVLREALALLGADCKVAVVRLHPQDLAALGEQIQSQFADLSLSLRADSSVLPSGCLVESAGRVVDATIGQRWQRAVASLGLQSSWES